MCLQRPTALLACGLGWRVYIVLLQCGHTLGGSHRLSQVGIHHVVGGKIKSTSCFAHSATISASLPELRRAVVELRTSALSVGGLEGQSATPFGPMKPYCRGGGASPQQADTAMLEHPTFAARTYREQTSMTHHWPDQNGKKVDTTRHERDVAK